MDSKESKQFGAVGPSTGGELRERAVKLLAATGAVERPTGPADEAVSARCAALGVASAVLGAVLRSCSSLPATTATATGGAHNRSERLWPESLAPSAAAEGRNLSPLKLVFWGKETS